MINSFGYFVYICRVYRCIHYSSGTMTDFDNVIIGIDLLNLGENPVEKGKYEENTEKRGKLWDMMNRYDRKHASQNQVLDRIINAGNRYANRSKKDAQKFSRRGVGCSKNIRRRNRRRMLKGDLFKRQWDGSLVQIKKRMSYVVRNGKPVCYFRPYGLLYGHGRVKFVDENGTIYRREIEDDEKTKNCFLVKV